MRKMTAVILRASGSDDNPKTRLKKAQSLFNEGYCIRRSNPTEAEKLCRESFGLLREAFLLTKDFRITKQLHRYGRVVHDTFRCIIPFEDGEYEQSCPVSLSHLRHGVSPGISGTEICSICGANMLDCDHVKGWLYSNVPARKAQGACNICRQESCEHEPGKRYGPTMAFAFMEDLQADHIAIVENPKDPLAAITSQTIDKEDILASLPAREKPIFQHGETPLFCHHCLECKGAQP